MKYTFLFVLFCSNLLRSQAIDYHTKKGYVADGYDVVAYFNKEALEGDKQYSAEFDGATYKFVSKKNLDLFKLNSKQYVPQYGGYCAYAIADKGKKVSINPDTFLISDGKLFLFYNAWGTNTLELWNKENPELLKQKADKNWKAVMKKE